jgi:UDP-N-acetylmuramate: L-alanyl-gamma-D-glutamyl-meso-diaminopimelate ligase
MKMGVMRGQLPSALAEADLVFGYAGGLDWPLDETLAPLGAKAQVSAELPALIEAIRAAARPGDQVLVMSNGGFGGLHERLLARLAEQ